MNHVWGLAGGLLLALTAWALWRALEARRALELERSERIASDERWQQVLDALDIGLMVFDAADRLVLWNADLVQLYPDLAPVVRVGTSFEELLQQAVRTGGVPEATGREAEWIAERVAQHRKPRAPLRRAFPGGRWRRITERFLADGGMLSYSIDITELVQKKEALSLAQAEAAHARQRLEDALIALPAGFELYDADDRLVMANEQMARLYPAVAHLLDQRPHFEDIVRANAAAGGLPDLPCTLDEWIERRIAARRQPGMVSGVHTTSGRYIRTVERRTRDGGLVGVRMDVTEEYEQRQAAEAATERLRDAIEALPDGFALFDRDDRLVLFNDRLRALYRESAGHLRVGARFEDMLRQGLAIGQYPQAQGREEAWLQERLRAHREPGPPILQELPGNRWIRIDERVTRDGGIAGVRTDVTALVRREQALERLNRELDAANARLAEVSDTDPLTGLANARALERRLAQEWSRAVRHQQPLSVLVLDVDHHDAYVALHGAAAGDEVLRQVAHHVAACGRRPTDLTARTDGARLVLLLPHTGPEAALVIGQRCLAAVAEAALPHGASDVAPHVTLSAGVSHLPPIEADHEPGALLRRADAAVSEARQAGRHRVVAA